MAKDKDKFAEHLAEAKEKFQVNIQGAFDCQVCDEYVREGYHDRQNRMLIWKCSQGHASYIAEISLG